MKYFIKDEWEYIASNGMTYFLEVEGYKYDDETDICSIVMENEAGESVEKDDPIYEELKEEALEREYPIEEHATDTSYYDCWEE